MRVESRLETAVFLICAFITIAFVIVLEATGMSFSFQGSGTLIILICIMFGLSFVYRFVCNDERIASVTFALGAQFWAAAIVGGMTLAALSWGLPLTDPLLARIDAAMGIDVLSLTKRIAANSSSAQLLDYVYKASIPMIFILTSCLTLAGHDRRLKEFTLLFVATISICGFIGMALPAVGAFPYLQIPEETTKLLPPGSGVYYLDLLDAYRSGREKTIDFSRLTGVITFPSFHLCMALLFSYAVRGMRWIFWPMAGFSGLTVLSIFPIGGHYAVDALGGCAVFLFSAFFASWLIRAEFQTETLSFRAS